MPSKSSKRCLCTGVGLSGTGFGAGDLVFCLFIKRMWAVQVAAGVS